MSKGILYYSHNILDGTKINDACREMLLASGLPITSVTHKPIDLGCNLITKLPKTVGSMIRQIIYGLENMTEDFIYFAEHDCLYSVSHFDIISGHITYNTNMWRLTPLGYWKIPDTKPVLSSCMGPREKLLIAMKNKLSCYRRRKNQKPLMMLFEPGRGDDLSGRSTYCYLEASKQPCLDIRHNRNVSFKGWRDDWTFIQNLYPWGSAAKMRGKLNI